MESFSTAGLRAQDTLPYWQAYVCKTYVPVEVDKILSTGFKAVGSAINFGRTRLTRVVSSPVSYSRTHKNIKISDHGEYLLTLLTSGEMQFQQNDRSNRIGVGDLCLLDTAHPYKLHCTGKYEAVHLQIPRHELDRRLPTAERIAAMRVAADGRYAQLAATMLTSTVDLVNDTTPRQLAPALIDLIALAFDESFSDLTKDNSRYARIVGRAQEVICDHLFDQNFDLSTIPSQIGVSARTLSRAFAQQGITPSKWMWSRRAYAARDMILADQGRTVSEVAMLCGFNDFSHFSRAFKAQFGASPSAMMARQ